MPKRSGFTLIELLIVIVIIAILSTIGLVLYGTFTKNARDAKRQSDLKLIQSALEDCHADTLSYPSSVSPGDSLTCNGKTYLNKVPSDPKPPPYPNYSYVLSDTTGYCLFAKLEGSNPTDDPGCTPSDPYNYGVTRP